MNYLWTPSSMWSSSHELRDRDAVVASMRFSGFCGGRAEIVSVKGRWTVKRTGFLRPRVIMQSAGLQDHVLVAQMTWPGDAILTLPSGESLRWKCVSLWRSSYGWTTPDGRTLVRFDPRSLTARASTVSVADRLPLDDPLPLILLGGYLLAYNENAVAAATVAAMG